MNNIQNYGMTNYQVNFQARGGKKSVKTLADMLNENKIISKIAKRENLSKQTVQIMRKIYNKSPKEIKKILTKIYEYTPELKCNCSGSYRIKNEGIIDINTIACN